MDTVTTLVRKTYMNPWLATEDLQGDVAVYYNNLFQHLLRFPNKFFVETGTLVGNGLNQALRAGFLRCFSVEIHKWCYQIARTRFSTQMANNQVELFFGNSEHLFPEILKKVDAPATFWLDAHISSQYGSALAKNCPIFEELQAISDHPIKSHTILIDDINCFDNAAHDWISLHSVIERCRQINPSYRFERLDAAVPQNILAVYL